MPWVVQKCLFEQPHAAADFWKHGMSAYQRKDHYYHKAKEAGFAARSVYKLAELDKKLKLIHPGAKVIEVGCAPGSWMQHLAQRLGEKGRWVGIDLAPLKVALPKNFKFFQGDIKEKANQNLILEALGCKADLVLSDAAPPVTGIKLKDEANWVELVEGMAPWAQTISKPKARLLIKVFDYPDVLALRKKWQSAGWQIKKCDVAASRQGSRETYWLIQFP